MRPGTDLYGRSETAWDVLTEAATDFLRERARLRKVTSYTELDATLRRRTGLDGFDFNLDRDRAAVGYLLERVTRTTWGMSGVMLSALVHYLDANDAGPGFYGLAQDLGLLRPKASAEEKWLFWVGQVTAVHEAYAGMA